MYQAYEQMNNVFKGIGNLWQDANTYTITLYM